MVEHVCFYSWSSWTWNMIFFNNLLKDDMLSCCLRPHAMIWWHASEMVFLMVRLLRRTFRVCHYLMLEQISRMSVCPDVVVSKELQAKLLILYVVTFFQKTQSQFCLSNFLLVSSLVDCSVLLLWNIFEQFSV